MNNTTKNFQNNLKKYLKLKGIRQRELAKYLNVSPATINLYVKGHNVPRMEKLNLICDFFNISIEELLGIEQNEPTQQTQGYKIPVLGTVPAGVPIEAVEDVLDYEELPLHYKKKGVFFGLKIKGNSMTPFIDEDDIIIVRQQQDANTNDIVIALINGNDATCKKLRKINNGVMLISINPEYEPLIFSNDEINSLPVQIIGKVIEIRRKL